MEEEEEEQNNNITQQIWKNIQQIFFYRRFNQPKIKNKNKNINFKEADLWRGGDGRRISWRGGRRGSPEACIPPICCLHVAGTRRSLIYHRCEERRRERRWRRGAVALERRVVRGKKRRWCENGMGVERWRRNGEKERRWNEGKEENGGGELRDEGERREEGWSRENRGEMRLL